MMENVFRGIQSGREDDVRRLVIVDVYPWYDTPRVSDVEAHAADRDRTSTERRKQSE